MDTIRTIYNEFFTVLFMHKAFEAPFQRRINEVLTIQPDRNTKELFLNYSMSWKFYENTLNCFVRCKTKTPAYTPFTDLSDEISIRFLLMGSIDFFKRTDIIQAGAKKVYFFNNRNNAGTNRYISQHEGTVNDDDLNDISNVKPDGPCFGVIDIYNKNLINADYELFTENDQQLKYPEYKICFPGKI